MNKHQEAVTILTLVRLKASRQGESDESPALKVIDQLIHILEHETELSPNQVLVELDNYLNHLE